MNRNRFTILIILVTLFFQVTSINVYANSDITVIVDGKKIAFDQQTIMETGRVLVPMRAIFEALGYTADWNEKEQAVYGNKQVGTAKTMYSIRIPQRVMWINYLPVDGDWNNEIDFMLPLGEDAPVKIINGRTMLPTRIIAESLGCSVNWDGNTKTVSIESANAKIAYPADGWIEELEAHTKIYWPEESLVLSKNYRANLAYVANNAPPTGGTAKQPDQVSPLATDAPQGGSNGSDKVYSVHNSFSNRTYEYKPKNPTIPINAPVVGSFPAKILIDENKSKELFIPIPDKPYDAEINVTEPYATGNYGGCNWYAEGRFWEVYGVPLPNFDKFKIANSANMVEVLEAGDYYDELTVIRDVNDIRTYSYVVFGMGKDGTGHVAFVEYVEKDENGTPVNIYLTEANVNNPGGQYRYGIDGMVKKYTFEELKTRGKPIIGYIIPNPEFYK